MKIHKGFTLISFASVGIFAYTQSYASPLVSIGDNTDIFFNGSSSVRWMSNVFREETGEQEDVLFTYSPGFEANIGRGLSSVDFSIVTRYDLLRYDDLSRLDTEQFHITASGKYKSSRLDLSGSASFDQEQSTSGSENIGSTEDLLESDNKRIRFDGEYRLSPKFSVGSGVNYSEKEYTTFESTLADIESIALPLDIFYELTPKLDLSVGYKYNNREVESNLVGGSVISGYDTTSHFLNVGFRGDLSPKLKGSMKVGYRFRDPDDSTIDGGPGTINRDDSGLFGVDGTLSWLVSPKFTTNLALSRDFGVSGEGSATEVTSAKLRANYYISSKWSASSNVGYTLREYTNTVREDDQYNLGARLSYIANEFLRFSGGYTYSENESNQADRSYENHILDITATLRY